MRRAAALALALPAPALAGADAVNTVAVPNQPKLEAVSQFAACVTRHDPERVQALLTSDLDGDEQPRIARTIANRRDDCIPGRDSLAFRVGLLRGAFAQAAFEADPALLDQAGKLAPAPVTKPDLGQIDALAAKSPERDRAEIVAEDFRAEFARCVAFSAPASVAEVVRTAPGSPGERAAIVALGDHLGDCMPEGVAYHLVPSELRPYLVSALHYATTHLSKGA